MRTCRGVEGRSPFAGSQQSQSGEWEQEEKRSGEIGSGERVAGADRIVGEGGARALACVTAIGVDDKPAERVDAEENWVGPIGAVSDADLEAASHAGDFDVETNQRSAFAAQRRCDVDGGTPGEIKTERVRIVARSTDERSAPVSSRVTARTWAFPLGAEMVIRSSPADDGPRRRARQPTPASTTPATRRSSNVAV